MARIEAYLPHDVFLRPAPRTPAPPPERRSRPRKDIPGLLPPGAIVDKYRVDELLGTGGFGAVYRATHLILRTTVALKLLRADVLQRHPEAVAQLVEEARLAASIQHPNVVRVFDVTRTPDLTYVVMEYIAGESLARALESRARLPPDQVARIGIDVAEGLEAGRALGIVHRDVKPGNILLGADGRARIVDLGLARGGFGTTGSSDDTSREKPRVVGTRGYVAPEQLLNPDGADFRADVYSLGVTLREALYGRAGREGLPRVVLGEDRHAARALRRAIRPMTALDPAERPASYQAIVHALRAASEPR